MSTPAGTPVRRAAAIERLALLVALAPFGVSVVRASVKRWMPVGDAAYFTVRSADVFTRHHPLVGAWSSGSSVVGTPVNNLGPLQLDVLAPFTKVSPYLGTAVGSALLNAVSVAAVWFAARWLFRPAVVVAVMAATTAFVASLGLSWLIDARQQFALVLPFYALLWLSAALWGGVRAALPVSVVVASLTVQTHFTYVVQSLVVVAAGAVGFGVTTWRQQRSWHSWRRPVLVALVLGVICWVQPLVDQLAGTGNLGTVLGPARDRAGAGLGDSVRVVAGAALTPPFWLPGSFATFLLPYEGIGSWTAVVAVVIWVSIAGALAVLGTRRGVPAARALGGAGVVALAACLLAGAAIPVSSFGLVPQNYYWAWSLSAFLTIGTVAAALDVLTASSRLPVPVRLCRPVLSGALVAVLAVASWPRYPVASVAADETDAQRVGRPLRVQLAAALDSGAVDDLVEVDLSRAFFANNYPFVVLAELQRAGIEFRFTPESRNLDRFGESRCVEAGRLQRLLIIPGPDPELVPGSEVIAAVAGIGDAELAEYGRLQDEFGRLLRAGTVEIDLRAVEDTFGDIADLGDVLATEQMPATGLARRLESWQRWGWVTIPDEQQVAFGRWFELERRSSSDFQTVVIEQPGLADERSC